MKSDNDGHTTLLNYSTERRVVLTTAQQRTEIRMLFSKY